jgi:translocation and assembly module TamB
MRALRWAWRTLLALVLLPILLVLLVFAGLQTGVGQRQAAALIGDLASSPEMRVRIGGIDGFVPFDFALKDVALADAEGTWATVDRARLAWSPGALFDGVLQVDALTAGRVALDRLPPAAEPAEPEPAEAEPFDPADIALPDLPLGVRVDRLAVEEIALGAPVLGRPARLTAEGEARLVDPAEGLRLDLLVERTDETPGRVSLDAAFSPADNSLAVDLEAAEPPGGMLAAMLGLPGEPAVDIALEGEGPLADWRASLQVDAGDGLNGAADIRIERSDDGAYALSLLGGFELAALLPPEIEPLLAGGLTVDARARLAPDGGIGIEEVEASAPAGTVRLGGSLAPGLERVDLAFEVVAGDPAAYAGLLPEPAWERLRLGGSVAGPLSAPRLAVDVRARAVSAAGAGVDALELALNAEGPPTAPDEASLTLEAEGLAGPGGYRVRSLSLDGRGGAAGAGFEATADLAASGIAGPDLAIDAAELQLEASGPVDAPALDAALVARGVAAAGIGTERFALTVETEPLGDLDDPDLVLAVDARANAETFAIGDPALDELLTPAIDLVLEGTVSRTGRVAIETARLDLPALDLSARGQLSGWGETADVAAELSAPELSAFAGLAGMPLAGSLAVDIEAAREAGTTRAEIAAAIDGPETGIAQVDGLLGDRTTFALDAALRDDGAFRVPVLSLEAAAFGVDGEDLHLTEEGAGGRLTVRVPDLAEIDPALAGAVTLVADLAGSLARPEVDAVLTADGVDAAGIAVPGARLEVEARDLAGTPRGSLALTGEAATLPVDVSLTFVVEEAAVALSDIAADIASAELRGALTGGFDGTAEGSLTGSVGALSDFARLAGQPLSGAAQLDLALSADGGQSAEATLRLSGFALGDTASAATATVRASVADALAEPRLDAALEAGGISAGGLDLNGFAATARGGPESLAVTLDADGPQLSLDAAADLGLAGETTRVGLTRLQAGYEGETVALAGPATVTMTPAGISVDRLALTARGGRVVLAGRYGGADLDLTLEIADLPLALAELAAPDLDLTGTLQGRAALAGSLADPSGNFELTAADVGLAQARALGFAGIDADASGRWAGGRLDVRASVSSRQAGALALTAALPLRMAAGVPAVPDGGRLSAEIDGRIDLAALNTLLAAGGSRVAGEAEIDVAVGGTVSDPAPQGEIRLFEVAYTEPVYGIAITDVNAVLTGTGERFELTGLNGTTPGGGSIGGSGSLSFVPEGAPAIDISLTMDDANLISGELIDGTFDADLTLGGTLAEAALTGTLTVERAVLRIPESLPASVPTLDVEVVNAPPELAERYREERPQQPGAEEQGGGFALDLDVALRAPQEVYVRGRGLDVEVGGQIAIGGTAASPRLDGGLELRRGGLDLLGNAFGFERGQVTFTGGRDLDPRLDFLAVTEADELTVRVEVTGRASSPAFALSSEPSVPEDEILSRLLFGRSSSQLSAIQAIQLAESAATLTGLGASDGLLTSVRDAIGVDRLEITGGEDGEEIAVQAGRYVGEGIYVGVEQGLQQGSSEVTVEVEITDNITVESDVGSDAGGEIGINFQWDY